MASGSEASDRVEFRPAALLGTAGLPAAGASGSAPPTAFKLVEAGATLVMDQERMVERADKSRIVLIGVR